MVRPDHRDRDRFQPERARSPRQRRMPPVHHSPVRDGLREDGANRKPWLLIAGGMLVVAVLAAMTVWTLLSSRGANPRGGASIQVPLGEAEPALPPLVQSTLPPGDMALLPPAGATDAALVPPGATDLPGLPPTLPAPAPQAVLAAPAEATMSEPEPAPSAKPRNRNSSPALVFDAGDAGDAAGEAGSPAADVPGGAAEIVQPRAIQASRQPARAPASVADRRATVTRGTLIPAVLETAIDGARPGYVRAVVSTDVRSSDGSRVLVPRSTRLLGEYRARAGDKRAYVVWTQLTRPGGGTTRLAAPGGAQFFDGLGKASLMSIVGTPAGASAARVRPGEPIRVFAGKDLDLSKAR